ncbi:hypothetical protein BD560DRAFT_494080 [Blakeslea trispora]|nr:hypothetical protein BD560DRAFT_494080 [Blakeslea trispora]
MSQRSFFPTDKQLEKIPHLRAHLLQLEELQQQFFRDHSEEDHDEVRFFEVGQLRRPLVAEFRESFVNLNLKRRRNCWNQFVSDKKAGNLLIRNPEHQSLIKAQYDDIKANEQDFQELIKQTDGFNAQAASVAVPIRIAIYEKQMTVLQKLWSSERAAIATAAVELAFHDIILFEGTELKRRIQTFWETSPASVTAASVNNSSVAPTGFASTSASPVSDPLSLVDSYKIATEKRKYLQKYIRDEVLKLYQLTKLLQKQRCPYEVKSVAWL